MRAELGISESGLARVIHGAFELLELIVFFTAGEDKEAMARSAARGARPPGRPRARSTPRSSTRSCAPRSSRWEDLVDAGGYVAARDRGLLRTEGRDYVVADGDVVTSRPDPLDGSPPQRYGSSSSPPSFETVTWIAPGSTA